MLLNVVSLQPTSAIRLQPFVVLKILIHLSCMIMKYVQLFFLTALVACCLCNCSEPEPKLISGIPKIIISCSVPDNYDQLFPNPRHEDIKDISVLFWSSADNMGIHTGWNNVISKKSRGDVKWVLQSKGPVFVTTAFQQTGVVLSPGDSVHINITSKGITYSGKGAESFELQYKVQRAQNSIAKPMAYSFKISSVEDYLKWNTCLNQRLTASLAVIDTYDNKIPASVIKTIKANAIYNIEFSRAEAFRVLDSYRTKHKELSVTSADIAAIYDSTMNGSQAQWLRECSDCSVPTWYFYQYNRIQVARKNNFEEPGDSSMNTEGNRRMVYYETLKANYKGLLRERLLQYVVAKETVKHLGLSNPIAVTILNDYYKQPGFPEYKQWMKKYIDSLQQAQKIAQK